MNLMELAKKQTMLKRKLQVAEKRLQSNLDKKNKAQAELDDFERMVSLKVTGGSTKASMPVKDWRKRMKEMYKLHGSRFQNGGLPQFLAQMMATGEILPNDAGIITILAVWEFDKKYGTNSVYNNARYALRKVANVYGLEWPEHAAGMKVS